MDEPLVDLDAHSQRVKVRLRLAMAAAKEAMLRFGLPGALHACTAGDVTSLWIGPDQWLLTSDRTSATDIISLCSGALGTLRHHAVDVSSALACASMRGLQTRALFAMGSAVNSIAVGQSTRTRFASIPVVVHAPADSSFDLYYDRCYRHYLERWFAHASSDPLIAELPCRSSF